ncbi:YiiX/YebB-like N1pC/P60 family cysteine hydrolase [Bradyrhizobium commune]|uniref:Uncharacterized protein n=1 Tax=Bradyrhizobium commune TaxID=83627 RepID=A0A7S9D1T6_9BRAD|nr:YiiX/YebB-like N1pC/P60 family cysteine hydrolase [Bradyrhizobium commune]QPF89633.1 hypothetical protein IC761_24390 [Bradyrhizobium commune]
MLVTSPQKVMPRINRLLQAVVRLTPRSSFSHVALSLGGDLIAESLTEDGVRIKSLQKFLENIEMASGLVLRPKDRTRLDDVFRGARYYYGARYNWKFMLPKPAGREAFHLFCSEFVSRVFQGLGYPEFGRRAAEKTLPVDLARLSLEPGWTTFKLADLLEPEPEPLPDLSSLEQDPTLAAIIERARQRASDVPRQRQLAEQHLDAIVKANDSEFILTQAANAFFPPALAYFRALLEDLNACRDIDEQIELLTRRTGKDPWSHLPRIASFIARPLDPPAPPSFAAENRADRDMFRDRQLQLNTLIANMALKLLTDFAMNLQRLLLLARYFADHDHPTELKSLVDSIAEIRGSVAPIFDEIDSIRERLASALKDRAVHPDDDPRFELRALLARCFTGLQFVTMLKPLNADAAIEEQIAAVLAIGEAFDRHRSDPPGP